MKEILKSLFYKSTSRNVFSLFRKTAFELKSFSKRNFFFKKPDKERFSRKTQD